MFLIRYVSYSQAELHQYNEINGQNSVVRFYGTRCTSEIAPVRFVRQNKHSGLDHIMLLSMPALPNMPIKLCDPDSSFRFGLRNSDSYCEKLSSVFLTLQTTTIAQYYGEWFFLIFCWFNTPGSKLANFRASSGVTAAKYLFNPPRSFNFSISSFSVGKKHNIKPFLLGTMPFSW